MLYSVCLRFSTTPNPLPLGHAPCTVWRPVSESYVSLDLTAEGTLNNFDYFNMPLWPPYQPTPLTNKQVEAILKEVRGIAVYYVSVSDLCVFPKTDCLHTSTITLDNVHLEVSGVSGKLGAATFNAQDGDTILFYAALKDAEGQPIRSSDQVTMTLTGKPGAVPMLDEDIAPDDDVYTRWETLTGTGVKTAAVYYRGQKLDELEV